MLKIRLLLALSLSVSLAHAQYVTLSGGISALLKSKFPDCFSGNLLDTVCAATKTGSISMANNNTNTAQGIQYFKSLTEFDCSYNNLTALPPLPPALLSFNCSHNLFTQLPSLPNGLTKLDCSYNKLTALPTLPNTLVELNFANNAIPTLSSLPANLTILNSSSTQLTSLPALPTGLVELQCYSSKLTNLPSLPATLKILNCHANSITTLPTLPDGLTWLEIASNPVTALPDPLPSALEHLECYLIKSTVLPALPKGLIYLRCDGNYMTNLPALPSGLQTLVCSGNYLKQLPSLPATLTSLSCGNNLLTNLPPLPQKLETLDCYGMASLVCLPVLPASLSSLNTNKTGVFCISNKPSRVYFETPPLICNPVNDRYNCKGYPFVTGVVYHDANKNNQRDAGEPPMRNVKLFLPKNGNFTFSNDSGRYVLQVDTLKSYALAVVAPPHYIGANQSFTPTYYGEAVNRDIALQPSQDVQDLAVSLITFSPFARRGFRLALRLDLDNLGTKSGPANVTFNCSSSFIIDSTSIPRIGTQGSVQWAFQNLTPSQHKTILIYGRVLAESRLGEELTFSASVNSTDASDIDLSNNTDRLSMIASGAYDPNDKQGPSTLSPDEVAKEEYLNYTIRFQNTGTDTAFTVVIADTLSANLVPSTMEVLGSSHLCRPIIKGNNVFFEFLHILLPDSHRHEARSHGYVKFRIKAKNTLKLKETVLNRAAIYFDYNKPVITNTVKTVVDLPIVTSVINPYNAVEGKMAYPNPCQNGLLFLPDGQERAYQLYNSEGRLQKNGIFPEAGLDLSGLPAGLYLLEIEHEGDRRVEKIIVK